MNAPHVNRMIYKIITKETVDYKNAPAVPFENDKFKMVAGHNGEAVFEMKEHFSSEQEARIITDEFLHRWEIIIGLENDPGDITFRFDHADIVDLAPADSKNNTLSASAGTLVVCSDNVNLIVSRNSYPDPQIGFSISPDVETMYLRYKAYREGRDTLLSMAYLIFTIVQKTFEGDQRKAAKALNISNKILSKLRILSSTSGNEMEARKAPIGNFVGLTGKEAAWVSAACKLLIKRCGEFEYCGISNLSLLTMNDLPPLS